MSAKAPGRYTRVGDKKGPLVIGGALKKMEEDPSFVYIPMFKIAGPLPSVEKWLTENKNSSKKEALKGSYSLASLKNKSTRSAFDNEVENATEERAAVSHTRSELRQINLMVLVELLKQYNDQKKQGVSEPTTSSKSSVDFKTKIKSLPGENKVFDVTDLKQKGSGGKKIVFKEGSSKRRLSTFDSDPFYYVVYNPLNKSSVSGVKNFLKNYGGFSADQIGRLTEAIKSGSVVNISRGRSPTRSPVASPSRRSRKSPSRKSKAASNDIDDLLNNLA